jgi:NAD+--dinitrogen-reductase ADP-D-ribosyltransferase
MNEIDQIAYPESQTAWYTTNLVGMPAGLIASPAFNEHPVRLRIHGTRESALGLFRLLDTAGDLAEASAMFRHYMSLTFGLHGQPLDGAAHGRDRSSYLRLIEGWGFDSNGPAAAVLKGWVESRFGLVPTYHRAALGRFPSEAWVRYLEEKMTSRFHNNCIQLQLDLLFEFCQWTARRFGLPKRGRVPVWRGVNNLDEHRVPSGSVRGGDCVLDLNNLVSFSLSRERAESFGDWMLTTEVPVQKLLFYPGLLGPSVLAGENEVIAVGGAYRVRVSYL